MTIGPFDVLNLETDDATMKDDMKTATDLTGTIVESDQPVAVYSGVETTQAPAGYEIPTYPGWGSSDTCCLDHLEEQMFPVESIGSHYVIARSPVRSTGGFREPDVLRLLGVAEDATGGLTPERKRDIVAALVSSPPGLAPAGGSGPGAAHGSQELLPLSSRPSHTITL